MSPDGGPVAGVCKGPRQSSKCASPGSTCFGEGPSKGTAEQGLGQEGPFSPQLLIQTEGSVDFEDVKSPGPPGLHEGSCVKVEERMYFT